MLSAAVVIGTLKAKLKDIVSHIQTKAVEDAQILGCLQMKRNK